MALDTRNKRSSALRLGWLPAPDGSVGSADEPVTCWQYSGFTTLTPTVETLICYLNQSVVLGDVQNFGNLADFKIGSA